MEKLIVVIVKNGKEFFNGEYEFVEAGKDRNGDYSFTSTTNTVVGVVHNNKMRPLIILYK